MVPVKILNMHDAQSAAVSRPVLMLWDASTLLGISLLQVTALNQKCLRMPLYTKSIEFSHLCFINHQIFFFN